MFMRLLQLKLNPEFTGQFKDFYESFVFERLYKMSGCIFAGLIKSGPHTNDFFSLTFWKTRNDAENYEKSEVFKEIMNQAKPFMSDSMEWKVQLSDKMELEYVPEDNEVQIQKYNVELQTNSHQQLKINEKTTYVRIVSMKIQENKFEEFKELYLQKIMPALKDTSGCRDVFLTESINDRDEFISVTIWDDKSYADQYEASGVFANLVDEIKHTFSQFYLWKMALEDVYGAKIKTTDDLKVDAYNVITGKSFT